jgi:two-component system cell cycle sensor histidine kinase/response regulator CckA
MKQSCWTQVNLSKSILGERACLISVIRALGEGKYLEQALRQAEKQLNSMLREMEDVPVMQYASVQDLASQYFRQDVEIEAAQGATKGHRFESRRSETASLRFLQHLFEEIPSPVFYKDTEGIFRLCNKAFEKYCALPRRKILGRTIYDLAPRKLATQQQRIDDALLRNSGCYVYEYAFATGHGPARYAIINETTYVAADGNVAGLIGVIVDITERKRREQELLAQNRLATALTRAKSARTVLRLCLEAAMDVSKMDVGSAYMVQLEKGEIVLAYSRGLPPGFNKRIALNGSGLEPARLVLQGEPVYGTNVELGKIVETLCGEQVLHSVAILPICLMDGVRAFLVLASRTLAEVPVGSRETLEKIAVQAGAAIARVGTEEALQRSIEKYWALMDDVANAIFLADQDGTILEVNQKAQEILGYARGELLGASLFVVLPPHKMNGAKSIVEDMLRTGHMEATETALVRKDGTTIPVSVAASVVYFGGRPFIQGIFHDISEQKKAQKALREAKDRAELICKVTPSAVFTVDIDGHVTSWNNKAAEITGFSATEMIGKPCWTFAGLGCKGQCIVRPENQPKVGIPREVVVRRKDGVIRTITKNAELLKDQDGNIISTIESFEDITERKRSEEELKISESRYRTVFENTGTAMAMFDKDMTVLLVNGEFERICGYGRGEIEGKQRWPDLVRYAFQNDLHSGAEHSRRAKIRCGDEVERDVLMTIATLPGTETRIASLIDISRLVYTEEVLRQSEERHRALVEQSSEGIFIVDPGSKKVLEANESFVNMLGYAAEEVPTLSLYDIFMESKELTDATVGKVLQKGQYFMGERNFRGKNSLILDVDVATALVRYGESSHIMISFRDITEKKRMEEALREAHKMEAVGTLAGGIAHDFNNILQLIAGYAYQLTKIPGSNTTSAHHVRQILAAADKGSRLTHSILAFSRKQAIDLKTVDVNRAVRGTEKFLRRIIGEDIEVTIECGDEKIFVMADQVQIEQALMNLATNAREAMTNGGTLTIRTAAKEMDEEFIKAHGYGNVGVYAHISFSDTGMGMSEETKRRIFDPFFTTKKDGKKLGLGMSVVYGIMKQHEGFVTVRSGPGMGTTVDLYLPLVAIASAREEEAADYLPATPASGTILLAEDDDDVRKLMKDILEGAGYKVIEADNGEDAVKRFKADKHVIDLAVMDVVMPKKSGKQAYDEMKMAKHTLKAIFMSGYTEEIIYEKGIPETGVTLLLKPVRPVALLNKVRRAMGK